jgi:hypothetical protein
VVVVGGGLVSETSTSVGIFKLISSLLKDYTESPTPSNGPVYSERSKK